MFVRDPHSVRRGRSPDDRLPGVCLICAHLSGTGNQIRSFLIGGTMKKTLAALLTTMFAALLVTDSAFAQGGNGTLTGTVEDSASALIPGVSITATNNATGVQSTTLSNESGAYNISSLLPGVYRLNAMLPGFQTQTFNSIELGTNETKRFNFRLGVATVTTNVEVA